MGKNRSSGGTSGGVSSTLSFTDEQWESAKTAEQLAELTGWTFTKTERGSYEFYDAEHDLTLFIDKTMLSNGFIDKNSNGKSVKKNYADMGASSQNLNDIVRAVYELPSVNKDATPIIVFRNNFKTSFLGYHENSVNGWTEEYRNGHVVVINSSSFKRNTGHSIRRTLLHETNHANDFMRGMGNHYKQFDSMGISTKPSFRSAIDLDVKNNGINGITKNSGEYTSGSLTYYKECWADAASIVQMKQLGYGSEKIQLHNNKVVSVDDWIEQHPNTYQATVHELELGELSSFSRGSEYNTIASWATQKYKLDE